DGLLTGDKLDAGNRRIPAELGPYLGQRLGSDRIPKVDDDLNLLSQRPDRTLHVEIQQQKDAHAEHRKGRRDESNEGRRSVGSHIVGRFFEEISKLHHASAVPFAITRPSSKVTTRRLR